MQSITFRFWAQPVVILGFGFSFLTSIYYYGIQSDDAKDYAMP